MEKNTEFQKLIQFFEEFPGVGSRQARRFALFLLSRNKDTLASFTHTLQTVKEISRECPSCMRYHFTKNELCTICEKPDRTQSILLVVEKEADIDAFERAHVYNGIYFVLGKLISLISKDEIRLTRLQKLLDKIKNQNDIGEIILAFPMTPNGLFTDQYVRTEIGKAFPHIQIKSLGRGFATGSDPEYVDTDTITYALQNRS